ERTHASEVRVPPDLDAPALVVGEMPVEDVELVQCQQIDVLQDEFLRHEMASDVEVARAPAEARSVLDLDRRDRPCSSGDRCSAEDIWREKLPQRLRPVEDARGLRRADRELVAAHREAVALLTEARERRLERERDARAGR